MYKIDGTKITLTRGDSFVCEVGIIQDGQPYVPQTGDSIRFALKRNVMNQTNTDFADARPLILKRIPTDTMLLKLEPSDTKSLAFGKYVYDIELTFADGKVDTFICDSPFEIAREVH